MLPSRIFERSKASERIAASIRGKMNAEQGKQPPAQQEPGPALFFCHLCQSAYRQPKLLNCLHSFCMLCLQDTVIRDDNDLHLIICPLCSIATTLPPGGGGAERLTDNPFLQRVSSEYVTEVKSHIVAKSLSPQAAKRLGPYEAYIEASGARRRFSEEMAQLKTANLTDEQKTVSSRNLMYSKGDSSAVVAGEAAAATAAPVPVPPPPVVGYSEFRRTSVDRGEYTVTATEAVNNMSRLQGKLMSLQGEALRVTYVIDRINQDMTNWHQHKEDLKQEVQRRSHQFQIAAKKMERQILSQIESKAVEDQFYAELDRGKSELRRNLKNILHEVSVLKCVNELGKYSEINDLSSSLLGPSAGNCEVTLDMLSYQFDVPTKPIDEMMAVAFGNLISSQEQSQIYVPEHKDFVNAPLDQMTSGLQSSAELKTQTRTIAAEGGEEASTSARSRGRTTASRRSQSTAGRSKRYTSDLGLGRTGTGVQEHLEEFQNARETFRNKRQEILRQGLHAREDHSPMRGEGRKLPWPNLRRGRVQSLDRSSNASDRINMGMKGSHTASDEASASQAAEGIENTDHTEDEQGGRSTDQGIPSPIIEEGVIPHSPKKGAETDDRVPTRFLPPTPSAITGRGFSELLAEGRQRRISLESSSRQSSIDESPPQSPSADSGVKDDFHPSANDGGRHLRKALSGATDKRSKMEFLRENWQKRKEILIQSRGFLSSEGATSPGKTKVDSLVSSTGGAVLPQRRFSDVGREVVDTVSPSSRSSVASALPLATARYQGQQQQQQQQQQQEQQQQLPVGDVQRKDTSRDDNDDDEQEVTSTVTIPIAGCHLNARLEEATKESITGQQVEDEQDEETVVMTETFAIDNTLTTDGATTADICHHQRRYNPPSTSATRAERTLSVNSEAIAPRSVTSHSTKPSGIPTSAITATTALTVSSASTMSYTSITTGTTLTAPSSMMSLRTNTTQSSSSSTSSTSSASSASTTTRSRLQSPSRLSTRIDRTMAVSPSSSSSASSNPSTLTTSAPATTISSSTTAASSKSTSSMTATSSTATPSSSTSYLGRFTKRQAPPMETIDVAALIANMYKPSSSSSTSSSSQKGDDKKTDDDEEKENVKNDKEKDGGDTWPKDQSTSKTIIETDREGSRYTFAHRASLNTDRTAILGKTPTVDSAPTKSTDITVYKITGHAKAPQSPESTAVSTSSQMTLSYGLSRKEPTAVIKESNANRATRKPATAADVLESEQREASSHVLPSSPRDLKVDETFNQAELSRKRYNPGSSRSSARSNRRHTVEISKTIPEGMRLSDMYNNPAAKETDPIPESRIHGQPQSDLHRTVIEEAQDEYAKDSAMARSATLTSRQMVGSSFVEPTSSSSSFSTSYYGKAQQANPDSTLSGSPIPSSTLSAALHVRETESGSVSPSSPTAATSMMLPYSTLIADPGAGQANAGTAARGKLRDIARKKKERWRRLTIS